MVKQKFFCPDWSDLGLPQFSSGAVADRRSRLSPQPGRCRFSLGDLATSCGWEGHGLCAQRWAQAPYKLLLCPADNHDIISLKLFQLMVEHTPDEENIDWTKIEPSVSLLKSPKGGCVRPPPVWAWVPGVRPGLGHS